MIFYRNTMPTYYLVYVVCCLAGLFYNHFFFAFCLTEVIFQVRTNPSFLSPLFALN